VAPYHFQSQSSGFLSFSISVAPHNYQSKSSGSLSFSKPEQWFLISFESRALACYNANGEACSSKS
jgi:hypothetical protein